MRMSRAPCPAHPRKRPPSSVINDSVINEGQLLNVDPLPPVWMGSRRSRRIPREGVPGTHGPAAITTVTTYPHGERRGDILFHN